MKKITKSIILLNLIALGTFPLGCETSGSQKVVILQPLGSFNKTIMDTIAKDINTSYGAKVYQYPARNMPKAFYARIKTPRYRADSIIAFLKRSKFDSVDIVIGLTEYDISMTKTYQGNIKEPQSKYKDWGVFGLGYRPGPSCVISSFRLGGRTDRIRKIVLHEVGHNLRLSHCSNSKCVMHDAEERISTIDFVNAQLCRSCKLKLHLD